MKIPIALHFINIGLRKHRFWGLYKWSKCYRRSRNSKFHFDQRLCWGRRRDRRRVKRCASWKTNIIRDSTCNRELLECWSLFDNSGSEIRQSLSLVSNRFDKHSLQTKKQSNTRFFQKTLKISLFYKEKTYAASYFKDLLLFYTLVLWKNLW